MTRLIIGMFCAVAMAAGTTTIAQTYPTKPIRVLTSSVGGGSDFAARLIGGAVASNMGQQVLIDNRGVVAIVGEMVANAAPDGYTLLFYANSLWLAAFVADNIRYDPVKDFAPIILAVRAPSILVVHPQLPVGSVKELIALAKARPGELNYASAQTGSPTHVAAELFNIMAGVRIVRIGYRGSGPAFVDLISGQTQVMFPPAGGVVSHIKSGRLKAIAVTTTEPSGLFPGLPTVDASLPGYEASTGYGFFGPAGTSSAVINRLNQEIGRVLVRTDVKERLLGSGVEPVGGPPSQLEATVKADMKKWGKLIKDLGIRSN